MIQKRTLSADDAARLMLFAAVIFGLCFRIVPAWIAGFPINDGGLFHTMILDLQANHYRLPNYTTYNNLNIPFAYPPAGFYISAIMGDLFHIPPLELLRWLPGIINTLSIPALYIFAHEITNNRMQSAISAFVLAMTPHLFAWLSMGGGLTRSLGVTFMILTLTCLYRLFTLGTRNSLIGSIIFGSLVVLSHTEAPIYTMAVAVYIWFMKSRSTQGMLKGGLVTLGVLIVCSPWYGMVLYRHGMDPLLSALQTGSHSTQSIFRLLNLDFMTEEPYIDLLGVIGLLGMAILIARKEYFIPGMMLVIFVSLPRSAHTIGNIPSAIAAGYFVAAVLLPAMERLWGTNSGEKHHLLAFVIVLIPYLFSNSAQYALLLSGKHVGPGERAAMQWAQANTDETSKFIVLTGEENPFCDASSEWFPSITGRTSLNTLQGREWLLGGEFGRFIANTRKLQACTTQGMDCLTPMLSYFGSEYDYIFISQAASTKDCQATDPSNRTMPDLAAAIEDAEGHSVVYRSDDVVIFKHE